MAVASRYARYCSHVDPDDVICTGHMPWVAPEAYAVRLFPAPRKAWLTRFSQDTGRTLPAELTALLRAVNGAFVFELSLYGLPPSLQGATPRIDRTRLQALDLATANRQWWREFGPEADILHFGGRSWTDQENIGYFWRPAGYEARRKTGEVVGRWETLAALLDEEVPAAEARMHEGTPDAWWH